MWKYIVFAAFSIGTIAAQVTNPSNISGTLPIVVTGGNISCPTCGSSASISGGTANFIPLFGSASTITNSSHIDDGVTQAAILTAAEQFSVNLTSGALLAPPVNTLLNVANVSGSSSRASVISYGSTAFFSGVAYGGTLSVPTAVAAAAQIGGWNAWAYNGTALNGPIAAMRAFANQTQSGTNGGSYIDFATTPNGSLTEAEVLKLENDGGITVPGTVTGGDKGAGTINAGGLFVNGTAVSTSNGTVTNVAETVPSWLTVGGSPITSAGTLAVTAATGQTSHQVIGTCGTATAFSPCALVAADLPNIPINQVISATGAIATIANGNNPLTINCAQTSNTQSCTSFGETSAATGGSANNEVAISTAANSAATVLNVTQGAISTVFPTAAVSISQGANTGATNVPALSITSTQNNSSLTGGLFTMTVTNTSSAGTQSFMNFVGGSGGATTEEIIDLSGNFRAAGNFESTLTTGNSDFTGGVGTASTNGSLGGAIFQGSHNSNTGSSVKAGYSILTGGMLSAATPNAAALEGVVQIQAGYLLGSAIAAVGDVVCGTTTAFTVTDCPTTPATNIVGIADTTTNPIGVVSYGLALVKFDGSVTLGHNACMGTTTAGQAHDNGSTTTGCVLGTAIGTIVADSGTITVASGTSTAAVAMSTTLALVQLHISQ